MRVDLETLGRSWLATTSDLYMHLLEPVQRAAADRMDDLLRQVTRARTPDRRLMACSRSASG